MEQGRARDAAVPRPYAPGASGPSEASAPGARRVPEQVRGEHTHSEPDRSGCPSQSPSQSQPSSPSPPVRRHSVRGQILDALRTALVSGELVPGEVYSAPVLGERFGVSATPVREAMQQLALEGAVEVVLNRGFRVIERSARELAELAEVRALLEVPVMLRLARTVSAERWAELAPLAEATGAAAAVGDRAAYAESDRAFHRALLALSGNRQLVMVADDLHRRSQWPLVSAPAVRRADLVADAAEHSALLDALMARDLPVVQSLIREHFTGSAG
ncbi:GntR family transcriptional regulator [Streptomyces scopuliridis]|uniref:GntR family transcriptional regulator n=1 Tax=Streptomyces scopuliridis TaxID=452529 RepID=A0ACD4ZEV9_9ACTN|nr:GntR family transcriptional regulator [Streptomyces scopuliridis]WSB32774.1 GntR family transcriptional regulator [Streptomyces scopuliridis]WSB97022.1 GntR family transcriptional regulator [Streptomyces scopuliridis]WSC09274.1 GntR family transcriptional regulator [Streptomyces scopuliridis]